MAGRRAGGAATGLAGQAIDNNPPGSAAPGAPGTAGGVVVAVGAVAVKRLGALPVIRAYLERLGLKERVDALAPVREVAHLTNGDVVAALVANRLTAPRPLYDIVDWAQEWAVEETFGIGPADLNDDRLGRCLDDVAAVHDRLRGEIAVQAMAAFGLATTTLRWDLTSVLVTGAYPEGDQQAGYAQLQYGYGGGDQKQVRYLPVTCSATPCGGCSWSAARSAMRRGATGPASASAPRPRSRGSSAGSADAGTRPWSGHGPRSRSSSTGVT